MQTLETSSDLVADMASQLDVHESELINYGIDADKVRLPTPVDSFDLTKSILDPQMPDWSAIGLPEDPVRDGEFQAETKNHVVVRGDNGDCAFWFVYQKVGTPS